MSKLDLTYANRGLEVKTMAVHDMTFHADDVFAAMLMRLVYPELKIIRTRVQEELDKCDLVADVGLVYDEKKLRFDHHQEGRAGARENGILYSAFGLIWKHWGMDICEQDLDLFKYIDKVLVQPIDAQDNGQRLYDEVIFEGIEDLNVDGIMKKAFNPAVGSNESFDEKFKDALDFAENLFTGIFLSSKSLISVKSNIKADYNKLNDKRFLVDGEYRPVLAFKEEMPELLFYVYPYGDTGKWCIKCAQEEGFKNRKDLPHEWAGKNGGELEEVSGIKDMDFCHNGLFICAAKSKEAILEALQKALDY